jgi:predicted ATPase
MPRRVYYLPAARSGTMAIHRELVRDLVRRATSPSGRVESGLVMTGVMADFLGEMISLEPHDGDFKDEAAELEREVLHGRLELRTERDGSQQALYANDAGSFELHRASSMVQELTPVVLYLKHLLKKSDLLLIEEPEAHLHPQAQTAFARAMVRLVNAGLMICLTTHSEFLLSEINNRIAAHRIGTVDARRLGISSTLDPERVGAYLFHPAEDGTAVERLTISAEDGISEDAFADVVAELYDESVRLERAAQR